MEIHEIQALAGKLNGVTFDLKWEHILSCMIANKMFCNFNLNEVPIHCSIKVSEENYNTFIDQEGFKPAPYLARYHWVQLTDLSLWKMAEWNQYLKEGYDLTVAKLPKRTQKSLKENQN